MFVCLSRKIQSLELCMGTNKGVQGLSPVRACVWPGLKLGLGHTGGAAASQRRGFQSKSAVICVRVEEIMLRPRSTRCFGLEAPGAGGRAGPGATKPFIPGHWAGRGARAGVEAWENSYGGNSLSWIVLQTRNE